MFIGRRIDNTIYGAWSSKQSEDEFHPRLEEVADNHPDLLAFLNRPQPVRVDPRDTKIAELEARLVALETKV